LDLALAKLTLMSKMAMKVWRDLLAPCRKARISSLVRQPSLFAFIPFENAPMSSLRAGGARGKEAKVDVAC
jgi:hypothetical protein